jgi:hypothetical protein
MTLVIGVAGGLWRLGWALPLPGTQPATFHGALTVAAFFGTVIGLEYAAASAHRLAYVGPACAALGGLSSAFGAPHLLSASLLLAGSVWLAALAFGHWRRDRSLYAAVALAGAVSGAVGNGFWLLGFPASEASGAWLAFLVLTILGERLELSHLQRPPGIAVWWLAAMALLLGAGALVLPWFWRPGTVAVGLAFIGLAAWLLLHDVARRNLRHHRQARFTAICLVGGYVWLGIGGLALPWAAAGGALYDAALHAVFIGFVFAAMMAHISVILPVLIDAEVPYTPLFYLHLSILNATLLLRVVADLFDQPLWSVWGGMGNALAIALFLGITATSVLRGWRPPED